MESMMIMIKDSMPRFVQISPQQTLSASLHYLPVFLLTLALLNKLRTVLHNRIFTDIFSLPSPPLPLWKTFTLGHDLIQLTFREKALDTVEVMNSWTISYGPIYVLRSLFGKPIVHVSSESALRTINITKSRNYLKTAFTRETLGTLIGKKGILLAEGDQHAALRAAILPALHHSALLSVSHIFLREGTRLAIRLSESDPDSSPDTLRFVRKSTFTVILETCFGEDVIPEQTANQLQEAYLETFLEPPSHVLRRNICGQLLFFLPKRWFGYREDLRTYIRATIAQICEDRPEPTGDGKPLLHLMMDDAKQPIGKDALRDTVLSFLAAGQVTTSMAVCWLFYFLACDVEWQDRVVGELRENWAEEDGLDALDRLPILARVVRECLRLYPPLFYETRQLAEEDELDGFRLPKGTLIRVPVLALQRSREVWGQDADLFNPDRFLREDNVARTRMFWLPFLHGPRSCVGQRFALLEIKAFAAQVLTRLEVFVQKEKDEPPNTYGVFATPRGMKLYFAPRK